MRLAKGELLFVTPVAAVFAAAFILLVAASPASTGIGREMIGTITYKNHFAERKSSAQVMWNALAQSSPVYNGDTIHTTAKSSAVLHLDKQADISLGEETLVRIDVTPKRAEILLDGGIISVRKESSGRELGIATTAGKISMKEGELSAQGEGDKLLVSVAEGRARVDAGTGSRELETGASLALESGRSTRPIAQLVAPSVGSAVYRASADTPTAFRWTPNPDRSAQAWRLVVASDAAFKQVEASCDAKGNAASLALSDGTHYWKIMASAPGRSRGGPAAGSESAVGWFHLLRQDSPQPIEPRDKRTFAYGEKPPLVSFSWSGVDNATKLSPDGRERGNRSDDPLATGLRPIHRAGRSCEGRLQMAGQRVVRSRREGIRRPRVELLHLSSGSRRASIPRAVGDARGSRRWAGRPAPRRLISAAPRLISAAPRLISAAPRLISAAPRLISATALSRGATIAAWDEVSGADYYDARIAKDKEGTEPLAQARTAVNTIASPVPLAPGDYFLQVRSVSGTVASDYSPPIAFTVTAPQAIVALSPAEGFAADPETRRVRFVWDDPNDAGQVKLQLSADPQFDRPILEILSSNGAAEAGIPESSSGRIYWRVAALSEEGGRNSSVLSCSSVRSFRMPDHLAPPHITGPSEGMVIDISSTDKVRLGWEPGVGANAYHVSLYQLVGSRRALIRAWDGPELYVSLPRLRDLGIGQFTWSLSALRTSDGETASRSPEEIAYFALSHSHPLPPPVVHRPANGVKP